MTAFCQLITRILCNYHTIRRINPGMVHYFLAFTPRFPRFLPVESAENICFQPSLPPNQSARSRCTGAIQYIIQQRNAQFGTAGTACRQSKEKAVW